MFTFITSIVGMFFKGPLGRILDTIDKSGDNETEREKARLVAIQKFAETQVTLLNGPGKWLTLFFIAPLGFWFTAVCVYSVLWCRGCAFPQDWTIAALPAPLDAWAGAIISALFAGGFAVQAVTRLRK